MPAGVEIINDNGTILIDSNDPSLCLRVKATVTSDASKLATYTLSAVEFPTLAVRSTAGWVALKSEARSGGGITWTLRTQYASQSVTLYVFDRASATGLGSYGVQIFDAAGKLTFATQHKPGRVAGRQIGNGTWTGASGKTYAAIISTTSFGWYADNPNYDRYGTGFPSMYIQLYDRHVVATGVQNVGQTIEVQTREHTTILNDEPDLSTYMVPPNYVFENAMVVAVDVTGY